MAALVDTNILVHRYDPRFPEKQRRATELLRQGNRQRLDPDCASGSGRVRGCNHPTAGAQPALLTPDDARREAEELLGQYEVLYPNDAMVRLALRGAAAYQFAWFDAHMWACAEHYGLTELISEDFQHGRTYGTVRVTNPFVESQR